MRNPVRFLRNTCVLGLFLALPFLLNGARAHAQASLLQWLPALAEEQGQAAPSRQPHILGVLLTLTQSTTTSANSLSGSLMASGADLQSAAMNLGLILLAVVILLIAGVSILVYGIYKGKIRIKTPSRE
jgi:hypothetical protein